MRISNKNGGASCCLITLGCVVVLCIIWASCSFTTVPAGNVGVVSLWGSVRDEPLYPGLHFINPFCHTILMNVQTQTITYSEDVPTEEGMDVHLEAAALIRLDPNHAVDIYKNIGKDYVQKVVVPQFRSVLRSITSAHAAKDLYTAKARESMTVGLLQDLSLVLNKWGVEVQDTPLKKLELPPKILAAIQDKLAAEQDSEKMQFILSKQRQEAQRQQIEAEGIAKYQEIIGDKINEKLLMWKGIDATERLAASENAKVVVIGNPAQGGLPLIFNPMGFDDESGSSSSNTTARRKQ